MKTDLLPMIVQLLYQLAIDLKLDEYVYHYWKDYPLFCNKDNLSLRVSSCIWRKYSDYLMLHKFQSSQVNDENLKKLRIPTYFENSPPSIFRLCFLLMKYYEANPYPCIDNVNRRTKNIIQVKYKIVSL